MTDYTEFSDEILQPMAASGDADAEEQLIVRYRRLVIACARGYFLIGGDREDLIQEGMMGLLSAIRTYNFNKQASFCTYAELCITRRMITAVHSASRKKHTPLNEGVSLDDILSDELFINESGFTEAFRRIPEEQVLARESADEMIHTYTRCLSKLESEVCKLFLQGLSYGEIAAKTGRSPKSIDNAVQRIRRKLARYPNLGDSSES
ncbi:MAG: sigma-70 family RNA polymerase sigma factor [Oscillospiraceae bacterium]|jgi:RNA polymerase sporulation-specific sigma factor